MAYFNNQWAIILGGSSGMGLAIAQKLASEGMHLCIIHRDRKQETKKLAIAAEAMRSHGIECLTYNIDALRTEKKETVLEELQNKLPEGHKIAVLVHSIARGNLKLLAPYKAQHPAPTSEMGQELEKIYQAQQSLLDTGDFQATLEAMALSLYDWVQAVFQANLFAKEAVVLGLSSEGSSKAWRTYAAVSVAKASLEALCRSIALEYAPYGIRCNVLQPGVTETTSLNRIPGSAQLKRGAVEKNPYHRLTMPQDVANVAYLLCREEAKWINGVILPVDGGESIT